MKTRYFFILMVLSLLLITCTGCNSTSDIYDYYSSGEAYNKLFDGPNKELEGLSLKERGYLTTTKLAKNILPGSIIAGFVSFLIGLFLTLLVKKQKNIKKAAIFTFMLGIPLFLFLTQIVLGFIAAAFKM